MKKLVFLEFIDEYEAFCRQRKEQGEAQADFSIIALEPKLQAYLKKRGVVFETSLKYFSNDSHKAMILNAQKAVVHINEAFKYSDKLGLSAVYLTDLLFYARFYHSHLMGLVEIIDNCVRQHEAVELSAAVSVSSSASLMIAPADRNLGELVKAYADSRSLKFVNIVADQAPPASGSTPGGSQRWSRFLTGAIKLYCLLFRKRLVLIPGNGYGFTALKAKLAKRVPGLVFISPCSDNIRRSPLAYLKLFVAGVINKHFWIELNGPQIADGELRRQLAVVFQAADAFDYKGITLGPLVERKVASALVPYFIELGGRSAALKELILSLRIKLIMSPLARGLWSAAGELSRPLGISLLFVSHGAHPVPTDEIHELELLQLCRGFMLSDFTDVALSTPIQEEHLRYFKNKYPWVKANQVKTGPLIFADLRGINKLDAKLKLGLPVSETVLTHAVTNKKRGGERFYNLETFDEYLDSLSDLIGVVDKMPLTRLIVRVHPGFELSDEELKVLLPPSEKFIISRQGPFAEVLAATDVLVSYSSTALDEALLNERPVILFDKWGRYNHFRLPVYRGGKVSLPVVYVNEGAHLGEAIGEFRGKKTAFNYDPYKYEVDYEDNFYDYVRAALGGKGALS
ncbi:hypothetical protein HZC35_00680 [Candidatus Saganbacteria bacterium]|nr:hypothetical protein [Candidatus Saganbacteria bacterium]